MEDKQLNITEASQLVNSDVEFFWIKYDGYKHQKYNEVHMYIDCEPGIAMELSDAFSFEIANA